MANNIDDYIKDMDSEDGAEASHIESIEAALNFKFPEAYKEFIKEHNGAEGPIGENSYLAIWAIDDIQELNEDYGVTEYTPEILYFGSDGGDMAYAFDRRDVGKRIFEIPFDSVDTADAVPLADSFDEFLGVIYNR